MTAKNDSVAELTKIFGELGDESNLTYIVPAYPLYYNGSKVSKVRCHKLIADQLSTVFADVLKHYGQQKIADLHLDVFGGCYNNRPQRGGTKPSTHAWGIAIDMYPTGNSLNMHKDTAIFAKPEYSAWLRIWRENGFYNKGEEKDYDYMHFQAAKPE
uniref:Putative peptidase n=1 Tax=viral metagenome TaxID=1070528 RepID=A0A6M3J3F3_9ZZZZ